MKKLLICLPLLTYLLSACDTKPKPTPMFVFDPICRKITVDTLTPSLDGKYAFICKTNAKKWSAKFVAFFKKCGVFPEVITHAKGIEVSSWQGNVISFDTNLPLTQVEEELNKFYISENN